MLRYTVDREIKTVTILSEDNPLAEIIEVQRMYEGFTLNEPYNNIHLKKLCKWRGGKDKVCEGSYCDTTCWGI